jgi:hypothetical protein
MAFENCISEIVEASGGKIDDAEARELLYKVFNRASRHEKDGVARADATLRAARELGDEERVAAAIETRSMLINKMRRAALKERAPEGQEAKAVRALLTGAEGKGRSLAESIDAEGHANELALSGPAIAELRQAGLLSAVMRRNKAFDNDIADELWRLNDPNSAPATGNRFAEEAAKILHRWQEVARTRLNDAGAHIGKLDHYVTRQSHDMMKIRRAGYEAWRDHIEPKLHERTFDDVDDREKFLKGVWKALSSGVHEISGGSDWLAFRGPGNLAKKASAERKLHFKSSPDWRAYNDRFGRGTVVDSILRGFEHTGRNTALMRHLGTNPEAMFKSWVDDMREAAVDRKDFKTSDALGGTWNNKILDILTGKASQPEHMTLAHVGQLIRVWQSLTKLGGVVLSSIPDIASNVAMLRWNGVPLLEAYGQAVMAPLRGRRSGEAREIADLAGVGINGMLGRLASRLYAEDMVGVGSKLLNTFHRINLLSYWTDSMQTGVGLMLSHNLARNVGREFGALPRRMQITLQRYGIEAPEWNAIRRAETRAADGTRYLLPGQMADLPDDVIGHLAKAGTPAELTRIREDLRTKLAGYIVDQTREGMNEPRAGDRAIATAGTQSGTPLGEAMRTIMQFKQFPITFTTRTLGRELRRDGVDVMGVAHLIAGTTLLGYVAMTAKELARGREPRKPDDPQGAAKLGAAAMLQGGGAGIYGDFLLGEANRMGGGLAGTLAGPTVGSLEAAHRIFLALRDGSTTKTRLEAAAAEGVQAGKSNFPIINLFYTRAALDYFILHRLQEAVNPGYLRRYEQRVKKENSQDFWLRPTASPY